MGYQLLAILKEVFRPGKSRHAAKRKGDADALIFGIETMRKYTRLAFELAKFLREQYPECRRPEDITPEMCHAFMETLIARDLAGGTLGIYLAFLRKFDHALRYLGRCPKDAPTLLPTKQEGGSFVVPAPTREFELEPRFKLKVLANIILLASARTSRRASTREN